MQKIIKTIKIINIIFIVIVGIFFILGSGFTLLGLLTSSVFRIIFGGYLIVAIFGILAFKKDYFLILSLIGWIIFIFVGVSDIKEARDNYKPADIYFSENKVTDYLKTHNFCNTVLDCVPVITSCDNCSDYNSAINKRYKIKFTDILTTQCDGQGRICDKIPTIPREKKMECVSGKCLFVDKK